MINIFRWKSGSKTDGWNGETARSENFSHRWARKVQYSIIMWDRKVEYSRIMWGRKMLQNSLINNIMVFKDILVGQGGNREQTLPTKSNPNPDLTDAGEAENRWMSLKTWWWWKYVNIWNMVYFFLARDVAKLLNVFISGVGYILIFILVSFTFWFLTQGRRGSGQS